MTQPTTQKRAESSLSMYLKGAAQLWSEGSIPPSFDKKHRNFSNDFEITAENNFSGEQKFRIFAYQSESSAAR